MGCCGAVSPEEPEPIDKSWTEDVPEEPVLTRTWTSGSQNALYKQPDQTVIIFDWDNTLFPSHAFDQDSQLIPVYHSFKEIENAISERFRVGQSAISNKRDYLALLKKKQEKDTKEYEGPKGEGRS